MPKEAFYTEHLVMSGTDFEQTIETTLQALDVSTEFADVSIPCIDCVQFFTWTGGEQAFYRDKQLQNPPKRCRECKKAKNRRLEAIELSRLTGKKHRIEVKAECASCSAVTTVPFFPSQGRPVYCRACFLEINTSAANGAGNGV